MDDICLATAAARRHLADAPAWAKAAIDQERERRGLPALFDRTVSTTKPAPPNVRKHLVARTLVGVAAPGISSPNRLGTMDVQLRPETIAPSAWDCVAADLRMGRGFDFRTGHDGKPFAHSDDPDVSVEFDPLCGMLFTIRGAAAGRFSWPAAACVSIAFEPRAWTKVLTRDHGWVRRIDQMSLRHVALLPPHHSAASYRQAVVLSVKPEDAARASIRLRLDARQAAREATGR